MIQTKQKKKKHVAKPQIDMELWTKQLLRKMQKFYLVGITGRTSFILQNLKGIKFKITIGNFIKCTCSLQNLIHCSHTLYILTQIFFIPLDHPLLTLPSYNDKQLRYIIANRRIHSNRITDFLKITRKPKPISLVIPQQDQDDLENLCAICHMQIVKSDAVTTCTNVCRNTFHLDCFSQWMKYELKNNGVVKCPLCRDEKTEEVIKEIRQKEYELVESINNKKVGICYNYYCDGCMLKEIEQNKAVYKCVTCEDVTLCDGCFTSNKHIKHAFIYKPANQIKWKQCQDRKIKKKLDADQGYIRMKLPNYKRLYNFLACTYPSYFSKNNRWNVVQCKKLDIKLQQLQCMICSDPQKSFLRKLPCGHFIHHKCLRKRIQKGKLYCKHQGQKFLTGYQSLLKQQQLNKKVQFQTNMALQQEQQEQEDLDRSGGKDQVDGRESMSPKKSYNQKRLVLTNSKTLKSLNNNSGSTSCDSRRKARRSKDQRDRSLVGRFNSSMRMG